jgi:hypothetical protein
MPIRSIRRLVKQAASAALNRSPSKPAVVKKTFAAAKAAMHAGKAETQKLAQKPAVQFKAVWVNPKREELIQAVLKTQEVSQGTHGVPGLFHGTPHHEEIMNQAVNDASGMGKLHNRTCKNGDEEAGLYGVSTVEDAHHYTGSDHVVEVASHGPLKFDADRGTPYLKAKHENFLLAVHQITNVDELKQFVRPSFIKKVRVFVKGAKEAFTVAYARAPA